MLKQELFFKLNQKLSPQQIQLMKLVQLPTLAFEERLKEELEENPALEDMEYDNYEDDYGVSSDDNNHDNEYEGVQEIETSDINIDEYLSDDEPSYKTQFNNQSSDDENYEMPFSQSISFLEHLKGQLHTNRLTDEQYNLADFLIGNIDDDGYIRRDLASIVDDLAFSQNISTTKEILENLLVNYIQKLEPNGVGARNLQECLLIQLRKKTQTDKIKLAIQIINESFEAFSKKHYSKLTLKYNITENQLALVINYIEKLNPQPGNSFQRGAMVTEQIIPDFEIKIESGDLILSLNNINTPDLRISKNYTEMLDTYKKTNLKSSDQHQAVMFIKQKLDAAKWFIDAVKQRQNTLILNMQAIMIHQKEYFLTGDEQYLKPMILKDIAEKIGMDISTVSRVANSKYISTPYGTVFIKNLFSESLTNDDGEEVSTREIKQILKNILEAEDKRKPITDERFVELLKEKGYQIARRTISKYREQLNIPVARLRKEL